MADRSLARIIAPLALLAALAGIVAVVALSQPTGSTPQRTSARATTQRVHRTKPRPHFYVVKTGDNLTVIATKTGVSIDTIQRLNPAVDPQALHAGERLRVGR